MASRRKVIIGATIVVAITVAVVAILYVTPPLTTAGVNGIYDAVSSSLAGQYIELKPDGTAIFFYGSYGITGTWELKGGNRILVVDSFGVANYMVLNGDILTPEYGGPSYAKRK